MKRINKIQPKDFDKSLIEVNGFKEKGFLLSAREIKHIRRCLRTRMKLFPSVFETDDKLTEKILDKFLKIGLLDLIRNKKVMEGEDVKRVCSFEGCKKINNLEIHHMNPLSNGGDNTKANLFFYCGLHHRYIELKNHLSRKREEVKYMENKLIKLEKRINSMPK